MIDYSAYNEETSKDFEELVQLYATSFFRWKAKQKGAQSTPIARLFQRWWMFEGPVNFRGFGDTKRFKTELLAEIARVRAVRDEELAREREGTQ